MTWLRAASLSVFVWLMQAVFLNLSLAAQEAMQPAEFHGIRLGMTEQQAFAHIDRIAPGAMIGALCSDNKRGVGSYLNYEGLDWQIMAHTETGTVDEIRLFRFDSAGTKTSDQCAARFSQLFDNQRQKYPSTKWRRSMQQGDQFSVKSRVHASLPDQTTIELSAERLNWDQARCLIELRISRAGT